MPRGKRRRISIDSRDEPGGKRGRYNLRSKTFPSGSDSDSNSSVIFVDSSIISPRVATLTKRNLKKRITQAKRNARKNMNHSRAQHSRQHRTALLVDTFSQTDEGFRCSSCGNEENISKNEKTVETIFANKRFSGSEDNRSEQSKSTIASTTNVNGGNSFETVKVSSTENVPQASTAVEQQENEQPKCIVESESENQHHQQDNTNDPDAIISASTSSSPSQLPVNLNRVNVPISVGTTSSDPYLTAHGYSSFDEYASPLGFNSHIEFGCSLEDIPVSPNMPDDMCAGDGTHNDPLQIQVIDMGEMLSFNEYIEGGTSTTESDGERFN